MCRYVSRDSSSAPWIANRERPEMVVRRRDEVGEAAVRAPVAVVGLLAQEREARTVDHDVIALGMGRPEPVDAARAAAMPPGRSRAGARGRRRRAPAPPDSSRIAGNLPFRSHAWKKNCQSMYGTRSASGGVDRARPDERRRRQIAVAGLDPIRARLGERQERLADLFGVLDAKPLLQLTVLHVERGSALRVEQRRDDVDDPARVEDVDRLVLVLGCDLDGGVLT